MARLTKASVDDPVVILDGERGAVEGGAGDTDAGDFDAEWEALRRELVVCRARAMHPAGSNRKDC
jgi:hypothetical protein